MDRIKRLKNLLKKEIVILDGAMGTELQRRGMPPGACPEEWCLSRRDVLRDIHRAYIEAGARVIYTATFGANRFKLGLYGQKEVRSINAELARTAREAAGDKVFVAGDLGPTGQFVEPFGPLSFEEAVIAFKEQALGLQEGGVDLFVVETMIDIQEARAALIALKEIGAGFTVVTVTVEPGGRTLNGTDPVTALITLQSLGADAVGCNCSAGPETMEGFIAAMKPYATVPLAAKPNAGVPQLLDGKTVFPMGPEEFAGSAVRFATAGVNLLGGCCGTDPEHISQLARAASGVKPRGPVRKSISALSSARSSRVFTGKEPLSIVGERINPTGKKAMQEELAAGRYALVRKLAREQERNGADLLDVNVGMPEIDEARAMREAISTLAMTTRLPLVIDSGDAKALEAALRLYPGRALVNSISAEEGKIAGLLPVAAWYGAMIIVLPLCSSEIPQDAAGRKGLIKEIFGEAKKWGFAKEDIIADALVMTAASGASPVAETLEVVRWCRRSFRCLALLGLTNISFGLPGRTWLNAAYLAMARERGLNLAIADPASLELMRIKLASEVLTGDDPRAARYIAHFQAAPQETGQGETFSPGEKISKAVVEGNREEIRPLIKAALSSGERSSDLMNSMMEAIGKVGELFERKVYFLPQLVAAAEAMKQAMEILEGDLKREVAAPGKGKIVLATVKGDIHDIGKNIVGLLLRNNGFEVIDLGKDVPKGVIVEAIRRHNPIAVGLSALMTTTMVQMKEVLEAARGEGLSCPFILGGAVVTEKYAESVGALYARDGVEAVRVLASLPGATGCNKIA